MSETVVVLQRRVRNFTVLGNEVIRDTRLSFRSRGLLAFLLSLSDAYQLRVSWLVRQAPEGRHAILGALGELQRASYLIIRRERGVSGRFVRTTWVITDSPEQRTVLEPRSENRTVVHRDPVFRNAENRTVKEQEPVKRRTKTTTTVSVPGSTALIFPPGLTEQELVVVVQKIEGLETQRAQSVLDEFAYALRTGSITKSRIGFFHGLVTRAKDGSFTPAGGLEIAARRTREAEETERRVAERAKPRCSDPEVAKASLAEVAELLGMRRLA